MKDKPVSLDDVMALVNKGLYDEAKSRCLQVCKAMPVWAEAWFILGSICGQQSDYDGMEKYLRRSIELNPGLVTAHYNLSLCLIRKGRMIEAVESLNQALEHKPDFVPALHQLAKLMMARNKPEEAITHYKHALHVEPDSCELGNELARIYSDRGMHAEAEAVLDDVLVKHPRSVPLLKAMHSALYDQGKFDEARSCCSRILALGKDDGTLIREKTMIPIIMESVEHIDAFRDELSENIDRLLVERLFVKDPFREVGYTSFQLAYHGRNDRLIQEKLAKLYLHACPSLEFIAPHCEKSDFVPGRGKIRIGFISRYLRNHSIGKAGRGLLCNLSKDLFETTAIFLEEPSDATASIIRQCADNMLLLKNDLEEARIQIAELGLDILFYQDIGMDPFTYFLAFSRLAPVQCTYFGHPVTTGIPNMDFFISTDYYETASCSDHYSEQLLQMHDVAAVSYCYRPQIPDQLNMRDYFGFCEEDNLYLCPQTLFKFHPEFDGILANILRNDPRGRILLKQGNRPYLVHLLKKRFSKTIPDVCERILFLPQQSDSDYMSLIASADVMLDTTHFGGFTTSLDAFVVGTPIVTMPNEIMRSRHTASFYRKMRIDDCVVSTPEDYVIKANALAMDSEYRCAIVEKVNERVDVIWEEQRVIEEFERIFTEIVH